LLFDSVLIDFNIFLFLGFLNLFFRYFFYYLIFLIDLSNCILLEKFKKTIWSFFLNCILKWLLNFWIVNILYKLIILSLIFFFFLRVYMILIFHFIIIKTLITFLFKFFIWFLTDLIWYRFLFLIKIIWKYIGFRLISSFSKPYFIQFKHNLFFLTQFLDGYLFFFIIYFFFVLFKLLLMHFIMLYFLRILGNKLF
jgi:hypothetical protein